MRRTPATRSIGPRHPARGTKVVVTGGSGFIGSHVVRRLIDLECRVTAVIRPGSIPHRLQDIADRITFAEGDIEDARTCRDLVGRLDPEIVFHLAWYLQPGDWADSTRNLDCLAGSLALLGGVAGTSCRRVVVAGSSVEYDTDFGCVTESSPIRPRTLYGASKAALFMAGEQLARGQGWSFAQARIFNVYGPGEDERRFVPHVVRGLLRGEPCDLTAGEQVRDYLHVEDVASALVALAASDVEGGVNVASSRPVTIATLAQTIGRLLSRGDLLRLGARPTRPGDYACLYADTGLLRDRTGWRPRYGLDAGLRQTIGWWQDGPHDLLRGPTRVGPRKGPRA